jgi:hypothetical protein
MWCLAYLCKHGERRPVIRIVRREISQPRDQLLGRAVRHLGLVDERFVVRADLAPGRRIEDLLFQGRVNPQFHAGELHDRAAGVGVVAVRLLEFAKQPLRLPVVCDQHLDCVGWLALAAP